MSSSIDNTECPKCGGNALSEQDTETLEVHVWCTEQSDCCYDSDDDLYENFVREPEK